MKIALLTAGNSHKAGGLYNSVRGLGLSIFHKGIDLKHYSYDDEFSEADGYAYEDLPMVKYHKVKKPILDTLAYSPDLINLLCEFRPDIIHSQGLWMYNSYASQHYKKKFGIKTIITPRGALDSWALKKSRIKKLVAGWLFENDNLGIADCIHALNFSEYKSIRACGLKNPVAIIPNGIYVPANVVYDRGKDRKILLFVGRINPKKGIAELLDALAILRKKHHDLLMNWLVRIAGWDQQGHLEYLKSKCSDLGLNDVVSFIGPVLGDKKKEEYLKADAFILSSFSEGLPMSVLEAWSYKLPVVMSDQCNLPDGFENNAAIRVTTDAKSIADGLALLFSMKDEERMDMGENGYNLVKKAYTWDTIADKTIQLYFWLINNSEKPDFVFLD